MEKDLKPGQSGESRTNQVRRFTAIGVVAVVLALAMLHWYEKGWKTLNENSGAVQAISAVAIALLTWALVRGTLRYVRTTEEVLKTTQDQADLLREQGEREKQVEIHLSLDVRPSTSTTNDAILLVANLSRTGIFLERLIVSVEVGDVGSRAYFPLRMIVPAFASESITCTSFIYESFQGTGLAREKYLGSVTITVEYRAHGQFHLRKLTTPPLISEGRSVHTKDSLSG